MSYHVEVPIKEARAQARGRFETEDKGKREKRQAAADRAKKKRNGNDEEKMRGGEEDDVAPSSDKRGNVSSSGSDIDSNRLSVRYPRQ